MAASEQLSPNPKHFDELLADRAIAWFREQYPLAPQMPFDEGWDKVRDETLSPWLAGRAMKAAKE